MEKFKERVRDRALDVLDWVDYRPDPHWWQYAAVPVVVAVAYVFTPMRMWPFILAATIFATVLGLASWVVAMVFGVAWRAMRDIIETMLRRRRQPTWRPYGGLGLQR